MKKKYVVIGSSAASMTALNRLYHGDPDGVISCITAEKAIPYNRCLLKTYLDPSCTEEQIQLPPIPNDPQRIRFYPGIHALRLNPTEKHVVCSQKHTEFYDKLFIGIGRQVKSPTINGIKTTGVFMFYTQYDITRIKRYIKAHGVLNAVVIGAGLTGLECADALNKQQINVTVIERGTHILPTHSTPHGAVFMQKLLQKQQITCITNRSVTYIDKKHNGRVCAVGLCNGTEQKADIVIITAGTQQNLTLVTKAGLAADQNGLIVNQFMQTSNPDIYAAGDMCRIKNLATGDFIQSTLWPDAIQQAHVAAQAMIGKRTVYNGTIALARSIICNTPFVSGGTITSNNTHTKVIDRNSSWHHCYLLTKQDTLAGVVLIGNMRNIGMITRALVEQTPFTQTPLALASHTVHSP